MENTKAILFTANRPDVVMSHGNGMNLWDTEGRKYLDFVGGWAVTCLGHCPNVMIQALEKQSKTLINASPAFYNEPMLSFANRITKLSGFDKVFFASSGAEANESAVKLARKYGTTQKNGAYEIVTTLNSFHGRTLAMMSATGKKHWEPLFSPKVEGFIHVPFNDLAAMEAATNDNTCAIMIEPIQGEGGVYPATQAYMTGLRKLCDDKGILLIFDEIQTGIGRTGKMFAFEHYGIKPDIMTLAKGIGGGYPLSAMLTTERLDIFEPGDQGGSYCAQPLGMAVGEAVVKEVSEGGWVENAEVMGIYLKDLLMELGKEMKKAADGAPAIRNIRGFGLLIAFDLPYKNTADIVAYAMEKGLLINAPQPGTIRLMPPLIVNEKDMDSMIKILRHALERCLAEVDNARSE